MWNLFVLFTLFSVAPVVPFPSTTVSVPIEAILEYSVQEEVPPGTYVGSLLYDISLDASILLDVHSKLQYRFLDLGGQTEGKKEENNDSADRQGSFSVHETTGVIQTKGIIDRERLCPNHAPGEREKLLSRGEGRTYQIPEMVRSSRETLRAESEYLDVELKCFSVFEVVVLKRSPQTTDYNYPVIMIKVKVEIDDVNDNAPTFPTVKVVQLTSESAEPGTAFTIPLATDLDDGINGVQRYELNPANGKLSLQLAGTSEGHEAGRRHVDGRQSVGGVAGGRVGSLRLVLVERLDREMEATHDFTLYAVDGGDPPRTGSVLIRLEVQDTNDNRPQFDNSTYELSIREDATSAGFILTTVHATDLDTGEYGRVTYFLSDRTITEYGDTFGLDPSTGELFLKKALDYETKTVYVVSVTAYDGEEITGNGRGSSAPDHATVVVRVTDANDNSPVIAINFLTASSVSDDIVRSFENARLKTEVMENQAARSLVAHVSVTDDDSGSYGRVACALWGDERKFLLERMFSGQYKLMTAVAFDRETEPTVNVTIVCRDGGLGGAMTSSVEIVVDVADENDNSPRFKQDFYSASIKENNELGAWVLRVEADDIDSDLNSRLEYKLDEAAGELLSINPETGSITADVSFDRETTRDLNFFVFAMDKGDIVSRSTSARVRLTVLDLDDERPRFDHASYTFGVLENQPTGTEVGHVQARDLDAPPHDRFSYSQEPLHGEEWKMFSLDPLTGRITTREMLDREVQSSYKLTVRVRAHSDPLYMNTASVVVYILDVNDNRPVFTYPPVADSSLVVSSLTPKGHVVLVLRAQDADTQDSEGPETDFVVGSIRKPGEIDVLFSMAVDIGEDAEKEKEEGEEGKSNVESWKDVFRLDTITGELTVASELDTLDISMSSVRLLLTVTDTGEPALNSTVSLDILLRRDLPSSLSIISDFLKNVFGGAGVGTGSGGGGEGTAIATVISLATISVIIILSIVLICVVHRGRDTKTMISSSSSLSSSQPRNGRDMTKAGKSLPLSQQTTPDLIRCRDVVDDNDERSESEGRRTRNDIKGRDDDVADTTVTDPSRTASIGIGSLQQSTVEPVNFTSEIAAQSMITRVRPIPSSPGSVLNICAVPETHSNIAEVVEYKLNNFKYQSSKSPVGAARFCKFDSVPTRPLTSSTSADITTAVSTTGDVCYSTSAPRKVYPSGDARGVHGCRIPTLRSIPWSVIPSRRTKPSELMFARSGFGDSSIHNMTPTTPSSRTVSPIPALCKNMTSLKQWSPDSKLAKDVTDSVLYSTSSKANPDAQKTSSSASKWRFVPTSNVALPSSYATSHAQTSAESLTSSSICFEAGRSSRVRPLKAPMTDPLIRRWAELSTLTESMKSSVSDIQRLSDLASNY